MQQALNHRQATIQELLEAVFSVRFVQLLYNEEELQCQSLYDWRSVS
jgi:hypothetical protein